MSLPSVKKLTRDFLERMEQEEAAGKRVHPYELLYLWATGRNHKGEALDVPLTVRLLAAQSLLRTRLAVKSQSIQDIQVADNRTSQGPGRLEIIQALSRATPQEIKAIFSKGEPLQITGGQEHNVTDAA